VREHVGSAHAPADLVELGEPERVGALDDQGVRLRDVETGLDDRGRDEHVRVAAQKGVHLLLELLLAHLAVRDDETEIRATLPELLGAIFDRLDAIVQEEALPASLLLARECQKDSLLVVLADGRADRAAALRRRLDDRDVAHPRE
jgi:hypothetical protein